MPPLNATILRTDANQRKILKHERKKDGLLRERKNARFDFALASEGIWVSRGKRREKERKAFIRMIRFLGITLKK